MRNTIELVSVDDLEPAAYNPREADEHRLRLLETSLRKLGFILPLYATPTGHLLSGHQRLLTAKNIGCTHVPVVRLAVKPDKVKNVNLVFNRATNDMSRHDTSDSLWGDLSIEQLQALLDAVPDKDPTSPEFLRALAPVDLPLAELTQMVQTPYDSAAVAQCMKLLKTGIIMPVVISQGGRVVNGSYRVMAAGELDGRYAKLGGAYPTIMITDQEAEIARRLLNLISMRFTVHKQYADQLRYGSFRRPTNVVKDLVPSMRCWADGRYRAAHEALKDAPLFWNRWRQEHGESVLDFGAGQRRNEAILSQKGIKCVSWEPYPIDWQHETGKQITDETRDANEEGVNGNEPSFELARRLTETFSAEVAANTHFTSIFANAVLNSVPFQFDRLCVLAIIHGLCNFNTRFYGTVRSLASKHTVMVRELNRVGTDGKLNVAMSLFNLDYEPNVVLGDINVMPKVQKFHTEEEIIALLKMFWEQVEIMDGGPYLSFKATRPKRVNLSVLKTAILHEFDLPYSEDRRLGMGPAVLAAFGQRLGVDFETIPLAPKPEHA